MLCPTKRQPLAETQPLGEVGRRICLKSQHAELPAMDPCKSIPATRAGHRNSCRPRSAPWWSSPSPPKRTVAAPTDVRAADAGCVAGVVGSTEPRRVVADSRCGKASHFRFPYPTRQAPAKRPAFFVYRLRQISARSGHDALISTVQLPALIENTLNKEHVRAI